MEKKFQINLNNNITTEIPFLHLHEHIQKVNHDFFFGTLNPDLKCTGCHPETAEPFHDFQVQIAPCATFHGAECTKK